MKVKIFEIWTLLEGTQSGSIVLPNLLKILIAIQGFTNAAMVEVVFQNISETLNVKQIIQNKSSLVLSEKDSKMIKKDFMNFYLTRFKLGESKLFSRELTSDQFTFHPSISKGSEQYADKYRERIIEESQQLLERGLIEFDVPEDGLIDHSTLLLLDQKIKAYRLQQKRQQSMKEKIRKQNEAMQSHSISSRSINETTLMQKKSVMKTEEQMISNTFSRISHNESHSRSKDQIFTELYEQGRRSKSNKRDKSTEQIEFESNKDELTFKPKINQAKGVSEFKELDLHESIPNFTKEVMRMRQNKNLQKQQLSSSPLLYLNVTMQGNMQTKIPIFQCDTFQQIVQKVRVIMKIKNGEQQKDNLKRILKEQIIPVLNQLGIYEKEGRFFQAK